MSTPVPFRPRVECLEDRLVPHHCVLEFVSPSYTVTEDAGSAAITLRRRLTSLNDVSVKLTATVGTADGGDFMAVTQVVTWANGDMTDKTVFIPITNDAAAEGDETINLQLSDWTGGSHPDVARPMDRAVLTILASDLPPPVPFTTDSFTRVVRQGPRRTVEIVAADTGEVLGTLGTFKGKVTVRLRDVNRDGVLDFVVRVRKGARVSERFFDGLDLSPLKASRSRQ